jgi:hypothetical protein
VTWAIFLAFLVPVLWAYMLFLFFLAYIPIHEAFERKALKLELDLMSCAAYATLALGLVLDIGFNIFFASLIFLELPETDNLTFTKRCRKWRTDAGYRGEFARWVCERLNVYQDRHC